MTRLTRRQLLAGVVGTATAALAGCGYRPGPGDVRWREDLSNDPVVAAGDALVTVAELLDEDFTTRGARFRVYDATTGDRRDIVSYETPVSGVTGGERCYFRSEEELGALDPDGTLRWTTSTPGSVAAMGAGADTLVLARADGSVAAYDGTDGGVRWRTGTTFANTPSNEDALEVVAVDEAGAVVSHDRAGFLAIDAGGDVLWEVTGRSLSPSADAFGVGEDAVLVPDGGTVHVVDRVEGEFVDGIDAFRADEAVVVGEMAYVQSGSSVSAYDLEAEESLWSVSKTRSGYDSRSRGEFVADERGVYVGDFRGVLAVGPDGSTQWTVDGSSSALYLFSSVLVSESHDDHVGHYRAT